MCEANWDRAKRMLDRICEDLTLRPEPIRWITAARTLSDRLIISFDTLYYLAELFTDCVLMKATDSDEVLLKIDSDLSAVERAHGLKEGQYWSVTDAPEEWRALNAAWEVRAREIVASALRSAGQSDIADEYERRPEEFGRRTVKGRSDLWPDGPEE